MRWTAADLNAARARLQQHDHGAHGASRKKYGNKKVEYQGRVFDSIKEVNRYQDFEIQRALGLIRAVVPQVSLPLPGTRRRIRIDFMIVELDGRIRWMDCKGFDTPTGKLKRDQVREAYGVEIELC